MMKKHTKKSYRTVSLPKNRRRWLQTGFLFLIIILCGTSVFAQNKRTIKGQIVDEHQDPIIGATVMVKDNPATGTVTDAAGEFILNIPTGKQTLVFSYIGMEKQEMDVSDKDYVKVIMKNNSTQLEDVVVVGYGQQKKESVVGSITQTSGDVLERAGGVTSIGAALTGNLPGVVTISSSGRPGDEDPQIIIRTQSSWNNSAPLILVDGMERPLNTVDISSVESVSVLKDASATAVYGVRGANGVILVTTKRGKEGKATIRARVNTTVKIPSKLPEKYDAYDGLMLKDLSMERELPIAPTGWVNYFPKKMVDKYRYPANQEEWDRYPNVDWEKELFNDYATSYNSSVSVSGGTKLVNYFASADYTNEGDLFKTYNNNRGYESGYGYTRLNVRSNLDFNLTKTTKFSINLFGSNGVRKLPWVVNNGSESDANYWASAYRTSPDAFRPIYSNGMWGYYAPRNADVPNTVQSLAVSGVERRTTTQLNTDFSLVQQLDMFVKGLTVKATLSMDNSFKETQRGINDLYNYAQRMYVWPGNGVIQYEQAPNAGTQLDFSESVRWTSQGGYVDKNYTYRKNYYAFQLNYARKFGKHDVTAMGLFSRNKQATGSEFSRYREDWVFRTTYNYATRYFVEINGAYNGSEKFGPAYRFAFFPSFSGGWLISNESFMKNLTFIEMLKFRGSWGRIGDDVAGDRFLYRDQWSYGNNWLMGDVPANTPYTYYRMTALGNPNISWETVEKRNLGVDFSLFKKFISGKVDYFNDSRTDIIILGGSRAIPSYFGATAPAANLGKVDSHGYELELNLNYTFQNRLRVWSTASMTHAVNKTIFRDDSEFTPFYQKRAGYAIGQTLAYIDEGFLRTMDDVLGSTERTTSNRYKLVGDYNVADYNADGTINSDDRAPYMYSSNPQNTYNLSVGMEWKGFSCFVQFYGVNNVTREVTFPTFHSTSNVAFVEGTYWTKENGGTIPYPHVSQSVGDDANGTRYLFDGSFLRLKNAEIAYTFNGKQLKKIGMNSCRIYLNGDNLFLWTKMPDDRESNFSGSSSFGAYPTFRRVNLGVDINF